MTPEQKRLEESRTAQAHWQRWGPYLSERQWGAVREDYSPHGTAWESFSFDQSRSRAYRWGEDGIAGISDNHARLFFSVALWNGQDPFLKERLFGLTGNQGNHGEEVKEYYFYLDNTPTHSYMKYLYKYPHNAFPYQHIQEENSRRTRQDPEFELLDTGVFNEDRYFDVFVEYAKNSPEDILAQITIFNRGREEATLHALPTLWFRNTWSWGKQEEKPSLKILQSDGKLSVIEAAHPTLGKRWLYCEAESELLFTDNETNFARVFNVENQSPYVKDGINDYVVLGNKNAVNPAKTGTKMAASYVLNIPAGGKATIKLRLSDSPCVVGPLRVSFELWSKQFYHYVIEDWLKGDFRGPTPPTERLNGRNHEWRHVYNDDILSMPDKWEYPWYAAWDLAFHTIPLVMIDPEFAKRQLVLLTREWYMHPNGHIPAYEWQFSDVNPPVHAWAVYTVTGTIGACHRIKEREGYEKEMDVYCFNVIFFLFNVTSEGTDEKREYR